MHLRVCVVLGLVIAASWASAQERIVRFVGFDGSLFAWSGKLTARAVSDGKGGWLEPVLDASEAKRWKEMLGNEGYDGRWSNFLASAKDLKRGAGDAKLKGEILFAGKPDSFDILTFIPGRGSTYGSVKPTSTSGLPACAAELGGPKSVADVAAELSIKDATGRVLWQLLFLAVETNPRAVLLPSREIVWLETLDPEAFARISATTGRPVLTALEGEESKAEPKEESSNPAWMIATIVLGLGCVGLGVLAFVKRGQDTHGTASAVGAVPVAPSKEPEYQAASRKLQQMMVRVPRTDALTWLREEAPQQVTELTAAAAVGKSVVQKLGVKDQAELDQTLSDLLDAENVHRQLWNELGSGKPREILAQVKENIGGLQSRIASDEKLMLSAAASAGVNASGISPQEAFQHALTKLKKQAEESQSKAAALQPAANTLEALKPTIALADQIRQALHGVRPALSDREVFAICGYLLNYSVANLQIAILKGDHSLRAGMLHNIRTISLALAQYEDSFTSIAKGIPAGDIAFTTERHEDQADYLTLLQKALDLRSLRLGPFVIATDAQGRAYSVTTALA